VLLDAHGFGGRQSHGNFLEERLSAGV